MDYLILGAVYLLAAPGVALALVLRMRGTVTALQDRITLLEARLSALSSSEARKDREQRPEGDARAARVEKPRPASAPPADQPLADVRRPPQPDSEPRTAPTRPSLWSRIVGDGLEFDVGSRWSVWLGGLTLGLGGLFLVRYSIEAGLLSPGVRVALGALLALVLLGLGEHFRRGEQTRFSLGPASIPAVLTAAGTVVAFGVAYAAYAIYGMIGPLPAFLLLAAIGVATLTLATLHGPPLAAIGLLGSYGAPLLVAAPSPSPWPIAAYALVVAAAASAIARLRLWGWLAIAATFGAAAWALAPIAMGEPSAAALMAVALAVLVPIFTLAGLEMPIGPRRDFPYNRVALASFAAVAALSTVTLAAGGFAGPAAAAAILVLLLLAGSGYRWPASAPAGPLAASTALAMLVVWRIDASPDGFGSDTTTYAVASLLAAAASWGWGMAVLHAALRRAPRTALIGAWTAAGGTLGFLACLLWGVGLSEARWLAASAALVAAVSTGSVFEATTRRLGVEAHLAFTPLAFGTWAAVALALGLVLDDRWVGQSLALLSLATAWVHTRRGAHVLRWLAAASALLALVDLARRGETILFWISSTPIFNDILWSFGLPAIVFALTAHLLLTRERDGASAVLEASALFLAALTVGLEIRHLATGGKMIGPSLGLMEQSGYTLATFAFSFGLGRMARRRRDEGGRAYDRASDIAAWVSVVMVAALHLAWLNPFFTGQPVPNAVLNVLLVGYALPAVVATLVSYASDTRHRRAAFGLLAAALAFAYVSLMVRRGWQGQIMDASETTSNGELWTYSFVWLLCGIAVLLAGMWWRSRALRLASGVVIAAVTLKVFLIDANALTGLYRAMSFLGLGAALILIGRLYQKLLTMGDRRSAA